MSKLMKSEWRDRISHWVRTLKDDFYQPLGEIQWEAFRTNEQLSLGEAKKEQFISVKPGFTWGNTYEYCWMKGHIQLSEEANGKRIVMNLKPDGEATLFVNDKAFGTYRASWVNEPHHYIVDNVLSPSFATYTCGEFLCDINNRMFQSRNAEFCLQTEKVLRR